MAVSVFTLMLCVYVLSPLAYVWALGLAGCGLSVFGSLVVAGSLATSGSILDTYFAVQIVKGGFELAGVILQGLAGLSSSNS
jgi:hypothetical protein